MAINRISSMAPLWLNVPFLSINTLRTCNQVKYGITNNLHSYWLNYIGATRWNTLKTQFLMAPPKTLDLFQVIKNEKKLTYLVWKISALLNWTPIKKRTRFLNCPSCDVRFIMFYPKRVQIRAYTGRVLTCTRTTNNCE